MNLLPRILLAVAFWHVAPAFAQAPKSAVASPALQKEFTEFIAKFRAGLKANDSAAIAGMTRLPYVENEAKLDAAQFRAKVYPDIFTAKNRACVQRGKATYDRDGLNNHNYFIFCGELIFVFTKTPTGFMFAEVGTND